MVFVQLRRVLTCSSCNSIFNRDKNASIKKFKIAESIINIQDRPGFLKQTQFNDCFNRNQEI